MPPTQLISTLRGFRRRVKVLSVVYGVGICVAAFVGLLLGVVLLDYLLNLPGAPRVAILLGAAGVGVWAVYTFVVEPVVARLSLSDVAGRLETAFPEFDDRLRSTVAILTGNVLGSGVMKERVVSEAGAIAARTNLNDALVYRPVMQAGGMALVAVGFVAMLGALAPNYARIAGERLVHPFSGVAWPKRVEIVLPEKAPLRVQAGDRVPVRISLAKGDRASMRPVVFYQYDGGPVQQEYMPREGSEASFVASLDAKVDPGKAVGSLKVWVKAGDDEREVGNIEVVPRLMVRSVEATVTPPAYAGLAAQTYNLGQGPVPAVKNSTVEIKVGFNKPLAGSTVELLAAGDNLKVPGATWAVAGNSAVGRFIASESARFRVRGTDGDGFHNSAIEEYELMVRPDGMPAVQIENPRKNEERTAVAVVPLVGLAEDDFGVTKLSLEVERLQDKKHWSVPLVEKGAGVEAARLGGNGVSWAQLDASSERRRWRASWDWDLSKMEGGIKAGDILEYCLAVTDNYSFNGAVHPAVMSTKLRITVVTQEELAARLTEALRTVAEQVGQVARNQGQTADETSALAQETKDKAKLDPGQRTTADRLTSQQSNAASATKTIADKLSDVLDQMRENKSTAKDLEAIAKDARDVLDAAAEDPMKSAVTSLSAAREDKQGAGQRNDALAKAQAAQKAAGEQLRRALDRMGNLGSLRQAIEQIASILKEQQGLSAKNANDAKNSLGKKPEEMSAEDRGKLDKNAAEQKALSGRTQKALGDMEKVAESMQKTDPTTADSMKQAAQAGQQQQVPGAQARAAAAMSQNQQAQAQQAQAQAEAGLQAMLDKLREAEKRKLAELAEKLATLQQQVANLVRRQANHNFDNLTVQGGEALKKVDAKTLAELTTLAERKADQPAAVAGQLSPAQEQTERNTRDIAKQAEEMPNAAEVGSALTRAAGKMERAIVGLRAGKWAEAYEPPQVEALATLTEAKKKVDDLKKEIDKQLNQNQKESLRQVYVKVRAEQEKLNKETARIDGSARTPDKQYQRVDQVRLNGLVTTQGKLGEQVQDLEEDLKLLGGTVYVWANRDLVKSMGDVKGLLAKPETDRPVQSEQGRILDQLDGMIASLDVKPLKKEFEQRSEGGGGQSGVCKKKLPTESELRLMKSLQQGINKETKSADAAKEKDKAEVLSLGTRQGELRRVLDDLLQKSSNGQIKLGPEPDPKDRLPEEAKAEDVENQETQDALLNDKTDDAATEHVDKETGMVGDRMARSRQRLALDGDPGRVTQLIQKRILDDLDVLIEQARKQEGQPPPSKEQMAKKDQGQKPRDIGNRQAQPQNQGQQQRQAQASAGQKPASDSNRSGPALSGTDVSQDIASSMKEWGGLTPRQRAAVQDGASDQVIEKYKPLVDDYYKSLATKGTEGR